MSTAPDQLEYLAGAYGKSTMADGRVMKTAETAESAVIVVRTAVTETAVKVVVVGLIMMLL